MEELIGMKLDSGLGGGDGAYRRSGLLCATFCTYGLITLTIIFLNETLHMLWGLPMSTYTCVK